MNAQYYQELCVEVLQECEDLWSTFCFEAHASGIETISETELTLVQRIFFEGQDFDKEKMDLSKVYILNRSAVKSLEISDPLNTSITAEFQTGDPNMPVENPSR